MATLAACGDSEADATGGATEASESTAGDETASASAVTITITSGISGATDTGSTSDDTSTIGSSSADGTSSSTGSDTGDTGSTTGTDTGTTSDTEPTSTTGGLVELGPGDLHFIGVNSDLPEGFALVALTDVPAGTELRFSERAWNDDDGVFEAAEGTATLVLDADLQAGTVFEIGVSLGSILSVTPDIGTITDDETGNWGIAGNGDNLFVYTGPDDDPTFIAGIAFSSPSVWTMDAAGLDGQSSMIPAALSEDAGTITTFSDDNLRYTGPRSGEGSVAAYLPLIADETNYETGTAAYTPLAGDDFVP